MRPFSDCLCDAAHGQGSRIASIAALLCIRCPSAIRGAVGRVYVHSVNRATIRSLPHILQKLGKVVPLRRNGYAPPSVIVEAVGSRIVASLHHVLPGNISRRAPKARRVPVRSVASAKVLGAGCLLTTATRRAATAQFSDAHRNALPTNTIALSGAFHARRSGIRVNYSEVSEAFANFQKDTSLSHWRSLAHA